MGLPSEIYDREYFLSDRCEGFDRFSHGAELSPIRQKQVRMLGPADGVRVLDAGCGRGEVLRACAAAGAEVAGFDYSQAAVELSRETLAEFGGADVRRADITNLPWPDASFDRILLGDVIEHLDPEQAAAGLRELRRVLQPGGMLLVHTAPNLLFLRLAWPLARWPLRLSGHGQSVRSLDAWIAESKNYHVNEQSVFTLRRALIDAGFGDVSAWIDPDVLRSGEHHLTGEIARGPLARAAAGIVALRPLRLVLGNDVYAIGRA
jgi:ubiquinone/menaquinone biosynthesis C-methylase UbiE